MNLKFFLKSLNEIKKWKEMFYLYFKNLCEKKITLKSIIIFIMFLKNNYKKNLSDILKTIKTRIKNIKYNIENDKIVN